MKSKYYPLKKKNKNKNTKKKKKIIFIIFTRIHFNKLKKKKI